MAFFEYCTKCGGMFSSELAWNEHRKTHENKAASGKKAFDEGCGRDRGSADREDERPSRRKEGIEESRDRMSDDECG